MAFSSGEPEMRKPLISNPYLRALLFCCTIVGVYFLLSPPLAFMAAALSNLPGWGPLTLFHSYQNIEFTIGAFAGSITIAIVFLFWVFVDAKNISAIRFPLSAKALPLFAKGVAVAAVLLSAFFAVALFLGALQVEGFKAARVGQNLIYLTLFYILILFISATAEEFLFRLYIFRNLAEREKPLLAIALSSVLFSLVHIGNEHFAEVAVPATINIFLVGVLLCFLYLKGLSLWVPVGFHFAWNFMLGFVISVPVSGIRFRGLLEVRPGPGGDFLLGGNFGPEGSWLMSVFLAGTIFLLVGRLKGPGVIRRD